MDYLNSFFSAMVYRPWTVDYLVYLKQLAY